jgi:hypothetical protein
MRFIFKLGKYLNMMLILPDSRQTKIPTKKICAICTICVSLLKKNSHINQTESIFTLKVLTKICVVRRIRVR